MTTLQIQLPDEISLQLQLQAKNAGFTSIEAYAGAVLKSSITQSKPIDETLDPDIQELLTSRVADPSAHIEWTPEFEASFRADIARRRSNRSKG